MDPFWLSYRPPRMLTEAYCLRNELRTNTMSVTYSMTKYISISDAKGRVIGSLYVDYEGDVVQSVHVSALDEPELYIRTYKMLERMRRYVGDYGWKAFRKSVARA